ncbi:hypothetical protein IRJ41_002002 [Triplophysa rosa]|uniref:Secreted protein n=1 Tax=Triplophysa rosa TaxID=992332 RepID=A0A9W7WTF6_TRIRA|nr:hypothetical protein IRJ41_002002 [Triplophysa rosa]
MAKRCLALICCMFIVLSPAASQRRANKSSHLLYLDACAIGGRKVLLRALWLQVTIRFYPKQSFLRAPGYLETNNLHDLFSVQ